MSLSDAKRELQWSVVMEALSAAGADAETVAMVERARNAGDAFQFMARSLIGGADVAQAKNYVKVEMVGLVAPFERAYVELVRPGGKTSHELREMLRNELVRVRNLLARGVESTSSIIEEIDETIAAEVPR